MSVEYSPSLIARGGIIDYHGNFCAAILLAKIQNQIRNSLNSCC